MEQELELPSQETTVSDISFEVRALKTTFRVWLEWYSNGSRILICKTKA